MLIPPELFHRLFGNTAVDVDQGDGPPLDLATGEIHHGNVDIHLGQDFSHKRDDPRAIVVVKDEDMPAGDRFDLEVVDAHDAVIVLAEEGAADRMLSFGPPVV